MQDLPDDVIVTSEAARLFDAWRALCRDGRAPRWPDFDPAVVPDLLRFMTILRPEPGGALRIAIFGTALRDALGQEITGRDAMDPVPGLEPFQLGRMLATVSEGARAFVSLRRVERPSRPDALLQAMCLPTLTEDGSIARLVSAFIPDRPDDVALGDLIAPEARLTIVRAAWYDIASGRFHDAGGNGLRA
jgi:hypothetical protein